MNDDLFRNLAPGPGESIDPFELARKDMQASLPKRFYTHVTFAPEEDGYRILLDGRPVRTPGRKVLAVPGEGLARAMAEEWASAGERVDPAQMPVTRIVNSAIDGVAQDMDAVAADIAKYAGSDLLCYRAEEPETLVAEQVERWDPVLDWLAQACRARFVLARGIVFERQPMESVLAFRQALEDFVDRGEESCRPLRLASLHVMTTLTGSACLALAVAKGRLGSEDAWSLAHLDEDFQMRVWGADAEAMARRQRRWLDMEAAARVAAG